MNDEDRFERTGPFLYMGLRNGHTVVITKKCFCARIFRPVFQQKSVGIRKTIEYDRLSQGKNSKNIDLYG